jgi:hypothetical protein
MPFTLTPYKILGILAAMLILVVISGFGGWHVRGWHDDSKQLRSTQADIGLMSQQFNGVINASNNLAATINTKNQVTESSIAGLVNSLGTQDHELDQIKAGIKALPVGTCAFTPDADGLYQRAYQTAFGTASHPAATAGKAGSSHASHRAAAAAPSNQ